MRWLGIVLLVAVVLTAASCGGNPADINGEGENGGQNGESDNGVSSAYHFSLNDMHGKTWDLAELEGNVVVLYFWHAGCPPCVARLGSLNDLAAAMPEGSHLLLVNLNDSRERIEQLTDQYDNLTVLLQGMPLFIRYGLRYTPSTVIFDREGKLFDMHPGFPDNDSVLATVDSIP